MSNLLLGSHPLIIIPELAVKIGLNETIIIQQVHYWNEINKKSGNNFKDEYYWTYNSYEDWHKQFPFWHINTIKKTIINLEKARLIISSNYNTLKIDRTKWYRIDYDMLEILEQSPLYNICTTNVQKWYDHYTSIVQPLPKTNTKTKTETIENDNGAFPNGECPESVFYKNEDVVKAIRVYMNDLYRQKTKKKHPFLKPEQYKSVYENISAFADENILDYDGIIVIMLAFFNNKAIQSDWNINHFATEGIMMNRFYEKLY
jgi:hypothetical protein